MLSFPKARGTQEAVSAWYERAWCMVHGVSAHYRRSYTLIHAHTCSYMLIHALAHAVLLVECHIGAPSKGLLREGVLHRVTAHALRSAPSPLAEQCRTCTQYALLC